MTVAPMVAVLGPQRSPITAGAVVAEFAPAGSVATVTAGWQEREAEDDEVNTVMGGRSRNLNLYQRAERVWQGDPELRAAHKRVQSRLRDLRRSYDLRLHHAMEAWAAVEAMEGDPEALDPEREAALETVRALDRHHLQRSTELRAEFEAASRPEERDAVRRERDEIAAIVGDAAAVAVAGGHVAVLLNRLRLFGVAELIATKPVVAWSAGAMALSERVVVFHDAPPQGAGHAEAFEVGLGLAPDLVVLPHAGERLALTDGGRVRRMARRFHPATCVALDAAEGVVRRDGAWTPLRSRGVNGARRLRRDGTVEGWSA